MPKRIMILATDGFEQSELEGPKAALEGAGFAPVVVAPKDGEITGSRSAYWPRRSGKLRRTAAETAPMPATRMSVSLPQFSTSNSWNRRASRVSSVGCDRAASA